MTPPRGKRGRPTVDGMTKPGYLTVRDRFLARMNKGSEVEWLIRVGKYVQHCWLIEAEAHRQSGDATFDDTKYLDLWNEVKEQDLIDLQARAKEQLQGYVLTRFVKDWVRLKGRSWPIKAWLYFWDKSCGAFVGAFGLTILVVLASWLVNMGWPGLTGRALKFVEDVVVSEPRAPVTETGTSAPADNGKPRNG